MHAAEEAAYKIVEMGEDLNEAGLDARVISQGHIAVESDRFAIWLNIVDSVMADLGYDGREYDLRPRNLVFPGVVVHVDVSEVEGYGEDEA